MEPLHFAYSLKNIPSCTQQSYLKNLINRTEDFISRIRWKAFFFEEDDDDYRARQEEQKDTFGFRSSNTPPINKDLTAFENDVYKLIASVKFRKVSNEFQDKINGDVSMIKASSKAIVPADKTGNFYQLPVEEYQRLINRSIESEYRKAPGGTAQRINSEAAGIADMLDLKSRMQKLQTSQAFVLLKDHKPDFATKLPCRLINPAKSDIGKVSKVILERISASLRGLTTLNQWRSTGDVIGWFNDNCIPDQVKFLQFDIESFYPSINESLLDRAIAFAREKISIPQKDIDIVKHSRQSLLFCPGGEVWQRKESLFDVTMGAPDGAEVCELVGIYILHKLSTILPPQSIGLYRDDGLIMVKNLDGSSMERIRKRLFATFKSEGLKITVSPPSDSVDFLDVTFRRDGSFRPFRKSGTTTNYVHHQSNHPPSIIRNIPPMINHRINSISSSKETFDAAKPYYEDALRRSQHQDFNMVFTGTECTTKSRKKSRKRNILWFNPPYSNTVETNIGRKFLSLIDKHFTKTHKFHKILNRNCVKVSYSCMPNVETTIKSHNKQLLQKHQQKEVKGTAPACNCRSKESCPLNGQCLTDSLVYMATLSTDNDKYSYVGMTEGTFKKRFAGHGTSFRHERYKTATKLSEKVWQLKDQGSEYTIRWSIIRRGRTYVNGQKHCDLCTSEKMEILLRSKDPHLLNSRSEILAKCRHKRKFGLE